MTAPNTDTGLQFRDAALLLEHTSTFVVLLGVALAASLGGADWSAGTMTTLLTWEPRRIRVLPGPRARRRARRRVRHALAAGDPVRIVQPGGRPPGDLARRSVGPARHGRADRPSSLDGGRGLRSGCPRDRDDRSLRRWRRSASSSAISVLVEGVIAGLRPSIQDRLLVRAGGVIVSQTPIYDESRSFSSIGPSNLPPVLLGLTGSVGRRGRLRGGADGPGAPRVPYARRELTAVYFGPSRKPPLTCGSAPSRTPGGGCG